MGVNFSDIINKFAMGQLTEEIKRFCGEYRECRVEVEQRAKCAKIRRELERLCRIVWEKLDISEPGLLLALLDAYEVTRDEGMLQEVLDVVSGNLERLEVSAEGVKLLVYCYYYVEVEECAVRAREMVKELRRRGESGEDLMEAAKVLEELSDCEDLSDT